MAFTYSIDRERGRIYAVAEGDITFADVLSMLALHQADGIVDLPELIDATNATPGFDPEEVWWIVGQLQSLRNAGPMGAAAVVVGSDDAFDMIGMLQTLASDLCNIRPFRSVAEAEVWLDEASSG